jgi:hypothetical protein
VADRGVTSISTKFLDGYPLLLLVVIISIENVFLVVVWI